MFWTFEDKTSSELQARQNNLEDEALKLEHKLALINSELRLLKREQNKRFEKKMRGE